MQKRSLRKYIRTGLLYMSLPVFLLFTNPEKLPLPLIVVPVLLFMALCFMTFNFIMIALMPKTVKAKRFATAGILAAIPTLLIILQSIHQLTIKDVLIVLGFLVLSLSYLNKFDVVSGK